MAIEFTITPVVTTATPQAAGAPLAAQHPSHKKGLPLQEEAAGGKPLPQGTGTDSPDPIKKATPPPVEVDKYAQSLQRKMVFAVDPVTGGLVVKVVDSSTGQVIREIPADEVPGLVRQLAEMQGQLLNAKA